VTAVGQAEAGASGSDDWRHLENDVRSREKITVVVSNAPFWLDHDGGPTLLNSPGANVCQVVLSNQEKQSLLTALMNTATLPPGLDYPPDAHWGINFLDPTTGKTFATVHLGLRFPNGIVESELNGNYALINDQLIQWLDKQFSADRC
jgi:hypothetical protein